MAVDLRCVECLKLWERHGAAAADLRDVGEGSMRDAIESRLRAAAQAISEHERQWHSAGGAMSALNVFK